MMLWIPLSVSSLLQSLRCRLNGECVGVFFFVSTKSAAPYLLLGCLHNSPSFPLPLLSLCVSPDALRPLFFPLLPVFLISRFLCFRCSNTLLLLRGRGSSVGVSAEASAEGFHEQPRPSKPSVKALSEKRPASDDG